MFLRYIYLLVLKHIGSQQMPVQCSYRPFMHGQTENLHRYVFCLRFSHPSLHLALLLQSSSIFNKLLNTDIPGHCGFPLLRPVAGYHSQNFQSHLWFDIRPPHVTILSQQFSFDYAQYTFIISRSTISLISSFLILSSLVRLRRQCSISNAINLFPLLFVTSHVSAP